MTEELPTTPPDTASAVVSMRSQRAGRVTALLDGGAHLHVWEPNRDDDPIDVDLTDRLAEIVRIGIDAPPHIEPHWTDRGGTTLIVSCDPGARGAITIDGHHVSDEAVGRLAASGFVELLRGAFGRGDDGHEQDG